MIPPGIGNVTIIPKGFDSRCTKDPTIKLDFLDNLKSQCRSTEEELWFEVMYLALLDYQVYYRKRDTRRFTEVFNWFFNGPRFGEEGFGDAGTFEFCCDYLNIDSKYLQKEIVKWTKKEMKNGKKIYN